MIDFFFRKLYSRIRIILQTMLGKVIFIIVVFILIGTIGFYFTEANVTGPDRPNPLSLMDCFYWTIITVTTIGFGDISPITIPGQILAIVLAFFGVAVISLTFATILEVALESHFFQHRKFSRMVHKMDEITLIAGYNERIQVLIQELATEGIKIVLVNDEPVPDHWDSNWGAYIQGDPKEDQVLENAGVSKAKKALIALNDDGDTLLTVLSIQALNPNCYTIAEVIEKSNVQHFERVKCNRIICQQEILGKFLNITLLNPLLYCAYDELISMAGKEIYHITKVGDFIDKSFEESIPIIKKKHDALLVGLVRGEQTLLNPDFDIRFQPNDILLVISETFVE